MKKNYVQKTVPTTSFVFKVYKVIRTIDESPLTKLLDMLRLVTSTLSIFSYLIWFHANP